MLQTLGYWISCVTASFLALSLSSSLVSLLAAVSCLRLYCSVLLCIVPFSVLSCSSPPWPVLSFPVCSWSLLSFYIHWALTGLYILPGIVKSPKDRITLLYAVFKYDVLSFCHLVLAVRNRSLCCLCRKPSEMIQSSLHSQQVAVLCIISALHNRASCP